MYGERPFETRDGDKASNFWPLAILSFGESWHNLHHADPTCARHGVLRGQIDISARLIWIFEKFGWASDVRWPKPDRLAAKLLEPDALARCGTVTDGASQRMPAIRATAPTADVRGRRGAAGAAADDQPRCGCPRPSAASS